MRNWTAASFGPLPPLGVCLVAAVTACGGSRAEPRAMTAVALEAEPMPAESITVPPLTELTRAEVDEALQAGFSRFLQEVRLEAALEEGRFIGFRVVGFADRRKWEGVGVEIGDVVTRVNDLPIERPEQAYVAFLALRTRSSLDVVYLRGGREMRLSLPIVGPRAAADAAAPPSPASSASPSGTVSPAAPPQSRPASK